MLKRFTIFEVTKQVCWATAKGPQWHTACILSQYLHSQKEEASVREHCCALLWTVNVRMDESVRLSAVSEVEQPCTEIVATVILSRKEQKVCS